MMAEVMTDKIKGNVTLDETCNNTQVVNELDIPILCMVCKDMVIATSCDGILISNKERSGQIKPYVEAISNQVRYIETSWGTYTVIDAQVGSVTAKVKLEKGRSMKYHFHEHQDEICTIISGIGKIILDGIGQIARTGDVITIAAGCKHTLIANTDVSIIEVQVGTEISQKDKELSW